jgi:hypothetical protein
MEPRLTVEWVEIERVGPPICGSIHRPMQAPYRFEGWLELVSALYAGAHTGAGGNPPHDHE